jgi:hypothetical protein
MAAEGGTDWEEVASEPEEPEEAFEGEEGPEAAYDEREAPPVRREPVRPAGRQDKSVLAMVSGLGFFVVVLLLGFGVWNASAAVPTGPPAYTGLTIIGVVLAIVIPYLWMLDDLRLRPKGINKAHARFMAGPLIGVLAILLFVLFVLAEQDWLLIAVAVAAIAITQASVSLFLYSMLWEE